MDMESWKVAYDTVLPTVNAAADLFSRMLAGVVSLAVAKAELRSVLAVASQRLDASDKAFAERDAKEDERIKSGR